MAPVAARSCSVKIRHKTMQAARIVVRNLNRADEKAGVKAIAPTGAYHCPHCGGFHVGHRYRSRRPS